MLRGRVRLPGPIDLHRTCERTSVFHRDPSQRRDGPGYAFAFRTDEGPVTVRYHAVGVDEVEVEARGPGAERALAEAPAHLGIHDRPEAFQPVHPLLGPLARRHPGIRFGRTPRVLACIVPVILSQKVTGKGALRSYRDLLRACSELAPWPELGLWLPPAVERLRELAYQDFHPFGVERKRAMTILEVVRRARRLEALRGTSSPEAHARLLALPGIGPWTAGHVVSTVFGDADAVPVGDYHLPHLVSYALADEPRGDDERMLELLEPFRPHRARVIALLQAAGRGAPRYGPRLPVRDIRDH